MCTGEKANWKESDPAGFKKAQEELAVQRAELAQERAQQKALDKATMESAVAAAVAAEVGAQAGGQLEMGVEEDERGEEESPFDVSMPKAKGSIISSVRAFLFLFCNDMCALTHITDHRAHTSLFARTRIYKERNPSVLILFVCRNSPALSCSLDPTAHGPGSV